MIIPEYLANVAVVLHSFITQDISKILQVSLSPLQSIFCDGSVPVPQFGPINHLWSP